MTNTTLTTNTDRNFGPAPVLKDCRKPLSLMNTLPRFYTIAYTPLCYVLLSMCLQLPTDAAEKVTFVDDVQPILREHCYACHNQDDATASLALDSFEGITSGGAGGEVVSAGNPDSSRLWKLVTHQEEPKMPPGEKLPEPQLKVLRDWIEGGLLKDSGSKPMKSNQPSIAKIDAAKIGEPVGKPAMPEQLFHEPVLWTPNVGPVDALATSSWAPLVAVAWQRQVSLYNTNTYQLLGVIPYVDGMPRVVRFSRDGSLVLVAGGQHAAIGSAALFDVKTGARLATLGDELDIVLAADISADLSLVAIGGPKKMVRVYRVADGSLAYQIKKHTDWITALGFSPDGQLLATADRSGGALLWQAETGLERADLRGHKQTITSLDWRADSTMLATASEDGTVRLWNPSGKQIKSVSADKNGVTSVRFAKNGNWVTTGRSHKVKTWKPGGGHIADIGKLPGMTLAAEFSQDSQKVIASDYTGEVHVLDVSSKKSVATLAANPLLLAQRFATAETSTRQTQHQLEEKKSALASQLNQVQQGEAAHAEHEKRLADAKAGLNTQQAAHETLTQKYTVQEKVVADTRQSSDQIATQLTAAEKALNQAKAEINNRPAENNDPESGKKELAKLAQTVELANKELAAAQKQMQQAVDQLQSAEKERTAAETQVRTAEATLAQIIGKATNLPDMKKLREQHKQAAAELAEAELKLRQSQHDQAEISKQQQRFADAAAQFIKEQDLQQAQLQELSAKTKQLHTQHKQAADQLAKRKAEQLKIVSQLKSLQKSLDSMNANAATSQDKERQLATQLDKLRSGQAQVEQKIRQIESRKRDHAAAEKLRNAYHADTK